MKARFVTVMVLLALAAVAQQKEQEAPNGVIYGIAIGPDNRPAKGVRLTASPLGVAFGAALPHTSTNDKGEYRFEHIPWWGRYTVYADDEVAGYSAFSTGPAGDAHPVEVELTPEHREANLILQLPPKAGCIEIRLLNRRTGAFISTMRVALMQPDKPESPLFSMSSYSNHVVLVPPDKDLLLHVSSDGFREWDESAGKGIVIRIASGNRLALTVQLDPEE
jgi:hypothetical protein